MVTYLVQGSLLLLPLFFSLISHMIIIKLDWLSWARVPIYQKGFGENKTWRGFLVVPFLSIPPMYLAVWLEKELGVSGINLGGQIPWAFGLLVGFAYVLFELPNSFIKRRMGVLPGKTPKKGRLFFIFLDQNDSALGVLICYYFILKASFAILLFTYVMGVILHLLINFILFKLGIRKNAL